MERGRQQMSSTALQQAQRFAEVATERAKVVQRLEELDTELSSLLSGSVVTVPAVPVSSGKKAAATTAAPAASKGKRGRPKGSKNKATTTATKGRRGRPRKNATPETDVKVQVDGSDKELPDLLTAIAQEVGKPMRLPDYLAVVLASGYQSEAKDKSNMVYQALNKLVKRGTLVKNPDNGEYAIADAA